MKLQEAIVTLKRLPSHHTAELIINNGAKRYKSKAYMILKWLEMKAQRTIFGDDLVELLFEEPVDSMIEFLDKNPTQETNLINDFDDCLTDREKQAYYAGEHAAQQDWERTQILEAKGYSH